MDVTQLYRNAGPSEIRQVVSGTVTFPLPQVFTDPLYVLCPDYSVDRPYGPCQWSDINGGHLPALGADAVINFDHLGVPVVVWWAGATGSSGTNTLPFSASQTAGPKSINHGLGYTPTKIQLTANAGPTNVPVLMSWGSAGTGSFTVYAWSPTSISGTVSFSWSAS